jgi:hypothetical protein
MNTHQNHQGVAPVDLEGFALHCWRQGPRKPLEAIYDELAAVSPFGHIPALRSAVTDALMENIGIGGLGLDGQNIARALNEARFRNASHEDIRLTAEATMRTPYGWEDSAVLAGLAQACELGTNAIAAAWAYGPIMTRKYSPAGYGQPAEDTGLAVPADELALLLAGMCPVTRRAFGDVHRWLDAVQNANDTAHSTLPLLPIAMCRKLSLHEAQRTQGAAMDTILRACKGGWISPSVLNLGRVTFGNELIDDALA